MEMLLLQDTPADTTAYFIAGYAIIFGVMALYILSIYFRSRNSKQELEILKELEERIEA
jgi:hypothetical protein